MTTLLHLPCLGGFLLWVDRTIFKPLLLSFGDGDLTTLKLTCAGLKHIPPRLVLSISLATIPSRIEKAALGLESYLLVLVTWFVIAIKYLMGATCGAKGWFDLPGAGRRSSSWRGEVWWWEQEEAGPGVPTVRKQKAMDLWIFVLSWLAPYSTQAPAHVHLTLIYVL